MSVDRRDFFRIAGLGILGLAGRPVLHALAYGEDTTLAQRASAPGEQAAPGPLTARRWAMVIDVKKCLAQADCTDCIAACHFVHNVPDFGNPKDEVKWIWKEPFQYAFHDQEHEYVAESLRHQPTLVFCNHCDNPPCVRVCPTQATWRREDGIVMMDEHRCIGCRYCVAACPYGSRSFNWRDPRPFIKKINPEYPTRTRGVVEKCDFCAERLAEGKPPVCAESCKARALTFGDLENPASEIRALLKERFAIRRKPALGTNPEIYYLV